MVRFVDDLMWICWYSFDGLLRSKRTRRRNSSIWRVILVFVGGGFSKITREGCKSPVSASNLKMMADRNHQPISHMLQSFSHMTSGRGGLTKVIDALDNLQVQRVEGMRARS